MTIDGMHIRMRVCRCVPSTERLILHFLSYVRVSRIETIKRYMAKCWQIQHSTVRQAIYRLCRDGLVVRVGYGKYSLGERGLAQLEQSQPTRHTA